MPKRSWPQSWDQVDPPSTEHAAQVLVQECVLRRPHILSQISNMASVKATHVNHLVRRCISSHSALIGELYEGAKPAVKVGTLTFLEIVEAATYPKLIAECDLPDLIWIERENGKTRPAFRYPLAAKCVQRLAKSALRCAGGLRERQFLMNGGVNAAADWLAQQIKAGRTIITTDFPNFFLTVNRSRLQEVVPFTGQFMSQVLFDPMDQAVLHSTKKGPHLKDHETLSSIVCNGGSLPTRGAPPGNAMTSIVTELALAPLLRAVEEAAPGVNMATYSDNIVFSAPNKATARAAVEALMSLVNVEFGSDVAGQLRHRMTNHEKKQPVRWLGRNFTLEGNKVRQRLSEMDIDLFVGKVWFTLNHAPAKKRTAVAAELLKCVRGWAAAHTFDPNAAQTAHKLFVQLSAITEQGHA